MMEQWLIIKVNRKSFMNLANKYLFKAYYKIWSTLEKKYTFNIKHITFRQ